MARFRGISASCLSLPHGFRRPFLPGSASWSKTCIHSCLFVFLSLFFIFFFLYLIYGAPEKRFQLRRLVCLHCCLQDSLADATYTYIFFFVLQIPQFYFV